MSEEELIETLRVFENKRVEQLEKPTRDVFYAIMKIADERDKYKNIIEEARECINHYAIEDDEFSKIYNQEEQELLEILDKENK